MLKLKKGIAAWQSLLVVSLIATGVIYIQRQMNQSLEKQIESVKRIAANVEVAAQQLEKSKDIDRKVVTEVVVEKQRVVNSFNEIRQKAAALPPTPAPELAKDAVGKIDELWMAYEKAESE